MKTAFQVIPTSDMPDLTSDEISLYLAARQKLGYSSTRPDQRIEIDENTTVLRWTHLGVVESREDAETLIQHLNESMQNRSWEIRSIDYPDADSIAFYRDHPTPRKDHT